MRFLHKPGPKPFKNNKHQLGVYLKLRKFAIQSASVELSVYVLIVLRAFDWRTQQKVSVPANLCECLFPKQTVTFYDKPAHLGHGPW